MQTWVVVSPRPILDLACRLLMQPLAEAVSRNLRLRFDIHVQPLMVAIRQNLAVYIAYE
jgi:hypothetical protein